MDKVESQRNARQSTYMATEFNGIIGKRNDGVKLNSTRKHKKVEICNCGCNIPRRRSRKKKHAGSLGQIWPLFKISPSDFSRSGRLRLHATGKTNHRQVVRSPSSLESKRTRAINSSSRRTYEITPVLYRQYARHMDPNNLDHGYKANNDYNQQEAIDFGPSSAEGLSLSGDAQLLETSHRKWEELSSALQREFEILGYSCPQNRAPDYATIDSSKRSVTVPSGDWTVDLVKETGDRRIKSVKAVRVRRMDNFGTPNRVDRYVFHLQRQMDSLTLAEIKGMSIANPKDNISNSNMNIVLTDKLHLSTVGYNKLSLKAEVGLNFLCVSQLRDVMEKAGASLHIFASTYIKVKRGIMKRVLHSSIDDKNGITSRILRPLLADAQFATPRHFKYGVEACVNEVVFRHFEKQSYGVNSEVHYSNTRLRQVDFLKEFYACEYQPPEQLMNPEYPDFNDNFRLFCNKKLRSVQKKIGWVGRWPSRLLQLFLEAMKRVWMAHMLAFSFHPAAILFYVNKQVDFDPEVMESPVYNDDITTSDDQSSFYDIVQFVILPGFSLQDGVVHSKVYLQPKSGITVSDPF